jgi:hypothetical protein
MQESIRDAYFPSLTVAHFSRASRVPALAGIGISLLVGNRLRRSHKPWRDQNRRTGLTHLPVSESSIA